MIAFYMLFYLIYHTRHISNNFEQKTKGDQYVKFLPFEHGCLLGTILFDTIHDTFLIILSKKQKAINMASF